MEEKNDGYLRDLYYNPESPATFGGVESMYRAVKNDVCDYKNKTHILYINLSGIPSAYKFQFGWFIL